MLRGYCTIYEQKDIIATEMGCSYLSKPMRKSIAAIAELSFLAKASQFVLLTPPLPPESTYARILKPFMAKGRMLQARISVPGSSQIFVGSLGCLLAP